MLPDSGVTPDLSRGTSGKWRSTAEQKKARRECVRHNGDVALGDASALRDVVPATDCLKGGIFSDVPPPFGKDDDVSFERMTKDLAEMLVQQKAERTRASRVLQDVGALVAPKRGGNKFSGLLRVCGDDTDADALWR